MEQLSTTRRHSSLNALTVAMVIGMFAFFSARESPGGLSGVQGFFAGTLITLFVFILAEVLAQLKTPAPKESSPKTPPQFFATAEMAVSAPAQGEKATPIQAPAAQ